MKNDDVRVTIRMQPGLRVRLKKLAAANNRKESDYYRVVLSRHVDEQERRAKT